MASATTQADTPSYRIALLRSHAERHRRMAEEFRAGKASGVSASSQWAEYYAELALTKAAEADAQADAIEAHLQLVAA